MDIPGRDPAVLLWAWWMSLALSCSLNLHHSPCGFLYNHLHCLPTTPLRVCVFLAVMTGDCGDEHGSKSICNQQASHHVRVSKMFSIFTVSPIYPNFRTFSAIFEILLNVRLSKYQTSLKFPYAKRANAYTGSWFLRRFLMFTYLISRPFFFNAPWHSHSSLPVPTIVAAVSSFS